ncbi:RHS repeat-associated core domain-containing protein [Cytobacillus firmus]|uniref:RHS repeat-associated core domain-containing protein n=1 Tax=Cytobacillus firmus TaxID=1399 RepID=UPI0018CE7867|nr:RHS repeat-associated core domain-containing protein [Cytobacillus firmus]MBG9587208.1 hypothetical protein [Cytobacillus firmus]
MKKIPILLLILTILLSAALPYPAMAENKGTDKQSHIQKNTEKEPSLETKLEHAARSGTFSKGDLKKIHKSYSSDMLMMAAYSYPSLSELLAKKQLSVMLAWSEDDLHSKIQSLSSKQKKELKKYTPLVFTSLEEKEKLKKVEDILKELKKQQPKEQIPVFESDLKPFSKTKLSSKEIAQELIKKHMKKNEKTASSSDATALSGEEDEVAFRPENSFYDFNHNVNNTVNSRTLTSQQSDTDLYLKGRHGLDVSLVRNYNQLAAAISSPVDKMPGPFTNYDKNSKDDGRGNSTENIIGGKNFIATGWSLNIPYTDARIIRDLKQSSNYYRTSYNRTITADNSLPARTFVLDDGTSYEFRGTDTRPYNHPYENVKYTRDPDTGNFLLTVDDQVTYEFAFQGNILSKKHVLGSSVTYKTEPYSVFIEDSVGRTIELHKDLKGRGYITGFTAKDKNGSVIANIQYNTESVSKMAHQRTFNSSNQNYEKAWMPCDYLRLNNVKDVLHSKTLKSYTYGERHSEFNLEDDYFLPLDNESKPILDYSVNGKPVENSDIVARDAETFAEMVTLCLSTVTDDTGFTVQYQYNPYNGSWYGSSDKLTTRGTIRSYKDQFGITYISYTPVSQVYYKFKDTDQNEKISQKTFINKSVIPEIWPFKRKDNFRLAASDKEVRPGDHFSVEVSMQNGNMDEIHTTVYRTIENGLFVTDYEYDTYNSGSNQLANGLDETQGDTRIAFAPKKVTSYQYDPGKTRPYLTKIFDLGASNDPKPQEVVDYLLNKVPTSRELPENIKNYANLIKTEYDAYGKPIYQEDIEGNIIEHEYNGPSHTISSKKKTSSDTQKVEEHLYTYNTDGTGKKITDIYRYPDPETGETRSDSIITEFTAYNSYKLPTHIKENQYGYQFGIQAKQTDSTLEYDEDYHLYVVKQSSQVALKEEDTTTMMDLSFSYDSLGRLVQKTFPDLSKATYTYDFKNRVLNETFTTKSGNTRTTAYQYDDLNRKVTQILPDGESVMKWFTPYGLLEKQEKKAGTDTKTVLKNETNSTGLLLMASYPHGDLNQGTFFEYGKNGTHSKVTDALDHTTSYYFANTAQKTDGSVAHLEKTVKMVNPDGKETWTYYDQNGNVAKVEEKNAEKTRTTTYTYSPLGEVKTKVVESGGKKQETEYAYDSLGHLIYLKDPENHKYKYVYNSQGKVIAIYTDGKLMNEKSYNGMGWLLSSTDAAGKTETYSYNKIGQIDQYTDKTLKNHVYTYTDHNQVQQLDIKEGDDTVYWEKFTYDPDTLLVTHSENKEGNSIDYGYDAWKRVNYQKAFDREYHMEYDDVNEKLKSLTYPNGMTVNYGYDDLGRIKSVSETSMGTIQYDYTVSANSNKTTVGYQTPNQQFSQETDRNSFDELVSKSHTDPVNTWTETFTHDGFGNITTIDEGATSEVFAYDNVNRLLKEEVPNGQSQYEYDTKGNRAHVKQELLDGSLDPLFGVASSEYTYNGINQLSSYRENTTHANYTYYPGGLRASKTVNGKTTRYVYFNDVVIEELDENNTPKAQNIYGNELVYRKDLSKNLNGYYFYNGHNDVVKIADKDGKVLNEYDYDVWGNIKSQTEQMSNPFKYTGQVYDEESGLYYLRARYYSPSLGQFITEDTYKGDLTVPLSLNWYTYAHNNPLIYSDPSGHKIWFIHGTFSGSSTWSDDLVDYAENLFKEDSDTLEWSGDNTNGARTDAAEAFVNEVYAWHLENPNEPIRLVGHSHGGNVGIMLANLLAKKGMKVETLITIATPVREYELETEVGQHINVYHGKDDVQRLLGGPLSSLGRTFTRQFEGADNVQVRFGFIMETLISNFEVMRIHVHTMMHSNVDVWEKYIEPVLEKD